MIRSYDGGMTWSLMPALDRCMTYSGRFRYANDGGIAGGPSARPGHYHMEGYAQPLFVTFHPTDSTIIVAGSVDAGVFISFDGGNAWKRLTDPLGLNPLVPDIPRPRFAAFYGPPGPRNLVIGSQGRGTWLLPLTALVRSLPNC